MCAEKQSQIHKHNTQNIESRKRKYSDITIGVCTGATYRAYVAPLKAIECSIHLLKGHVLYILHTQIFCRYKSGYFLSTTNGDRI